jgi:hypothetical protein
VKDVEADDAGELEGTRSDQMRGESVLLDPKKIEKSMRRMVRRWGRTTYDHCAVEDVEEGLVADDLACPSVQEFDGCVSKEEEREGGGQPRTRSLTPQQRSYSRVRDSLR